MRSETLAFSSVQLEVVKVRVIRVSRCLRRKARNPLLGPERGIRVQVSTVLNQRIP